MSNPQVQEASNRQRGGTVAPGAWIESSGMVRFRVWAPAHKTISVQIAGQTAPIPTIEKGEGWFELRTSSARAGDKYRYVFDNGTALPDPASRFQPDDVNGASEVIDPTAYDWQVMNWQGRPWREAVVYELHVGAFTAGGTFRSAIEKLDHLARLGITAIELMPIADFAGHRNWGYDGTFLYAPDASYGRPEDLKALIDAAHERGLMVFLDVVYNHFGPEGNYLAAYAPQFFTERHHTPWGAAINYDGGLPAVRDFMIQNALYWIEEFRFDGLRLDAVHWILDSSPLHFLDELASVVRTRVPHRHVHLLLENEENEAEYLERDAHGHEHAYTAQWNDDVHHTLHVIATGENAGYYKDYLHDTSKLARALAEGFAFQGEVMSYRGSERGTSSAHLPPSAFVAFLQNHDQIGNRAFGERLGRLCDKHQHRAVAAVVMLLPQIPMLFMGEEWNTHRPFPFFCDFAGDLGEAVRQGRRNEFAAFPQFHDPASRERIPDPLAESTFQSAKLDWAALQNAHHAEWLTWYRNIIAVRRGWLIPRLDEITQAGTATVLAEDAVAVTWEMNAARWVLHANLSSKPVSVPDCDGQVIWQEGSEPRNGEMPAWSVRWYLQSTE
ncbi:MAG: malto-oligosyltrehalose trehalohydrolase [Povalibacter sp.]